MSCQQVPTAPALKPYPRSVQVGEFEVAISGGVWVAIRVQAVAPEPPAAPRPTSNDFRCGEKVAFEDKYLQTVVGTIVRINSRTATIDPGDGTHWRVGFALLRHVVDV